MPLILQYTLSLFIFLVNNRDQFLINSEIHDINTSHSSNLHIPSENLDICLKGLYYSDIKIFKNLEVGRQYVALQIMSVCEGTQYCRDNITTKK